MVRIAVAGEGDQGFAHARGHRTCPCVIAGLRPLGRHVVEHQRDVERVEGAQASAFGRRTPVQLVDPGGRSLLRTFLGLDDGAAPGAARGGGGEEHLGRRVVGIQPAVLGDHHLRRQVDVLLLAQLLRQLVPGQCEVRFVVAQERARLVARVADDHRDACRLCGCIRIERMPRQVVRVQHGPEVE